MYPASIVLPSVALVARPAPTGAPMDEDEADVLAALLDGTLTTAEVLSAPLTERTGETVAE